jgi:hypothetical protein
VKALDDPLVLCDVIGVATELTVNFQSHGVKALDDPLVLCDVIGVATEFKVNF